MATKTDYYNRIISSLQSELTGLEAAVDGLQKEMEEMRKTLEEVSERNATVKHIPVESHPVSLSLKTLPRKEVEILISQMKAVCDEAIRANHENYVEMFVMRDELTVLRDWFNAQFLPLATFKDYQVKSEERLKTIEGKIGGRFTLLTIHRHYSNDRHISKGSFKFLWPLQTIKKLIDYNWVCSILVFVIICLLVVYLITSVE